MNLFRVSGDIKANWASIISNAHATIPYADALHPLSSPGCWGYPDMLEVGVVGQDGKSEGGLSFAEERTHFGLWCVISSPLTLSFDLGNATAMDRVWPIITNRQALAVSQSWHGHPGTLADMDKDKAGGRWQVWAKRQAPGSMAVLVINMLAGEQTFSIDLRQFGGVPREIRDIWCPGARVDAPPGGRMVIEDLGAHDSRFLLLSDFASGRRE